MRVNDRVVAKDAFSLSRVWSRWAEALVVVKPVTAGFAMLLGVALMFMRNDLTGNRDYLDLLDARFAGGLDVVRIDETAVLSRCQRLLSLQPMEIARAIIRFMLLSLPGRVAAC
jgi:hypothetical protein